MAVAEGVALALLAAGASSRFGDQDKLMTPLGGRPLVDWAARTGCAISATRRLVVTRSGAPVDLAVLGYERLDNADADEGLGSSLRLAGRWASETKAAALIILLADMPFVGVRHLERMVATFRRESSRPVFSTAGKGAVPQPPALFPAISFEMLAALTGDRGARALARGAAFVTSDAEQLMDVDTADDLERARHIAASRGAQD